jgi:hypothetical protein
VFHIRVAASGVLSFWDDDGSVIRRKSSVIHNDREAHGLVRSEIRVRAGERLAIAQWQLHNDWLWGASLTGVSDTAEREDAVLRYRQAVADRLSRPTGPPLKMFIQGEAPIRTILSIYSMVLNGYSPSSIVLFGEHQWDDRTRDLFKTALPLAAIHATGEMLDRLHRLGGDTLTNLARTHWYVMKACAGLLCPPTEFCFMDDDVFVLDDVQEALSRFEHCDAVYSPDTDHGAAYLSTWGDIFGRSELPTGRMNTGLAWLRADHDPVSLAQLIVRGQSRVDIGAWAWEQGLFANAYAGKRVHQLPSRRYLCPLWEGLPGGVLGYDYERNPCGFAAVHFAGLWNKPTDAAAACLAPQILGD